MAYFVQNNGEGYLDTVAEASFELREFA